jgi:hypothetical protein
VRISMMVTRRSMSGELGVGVRRLAADLVRRGHSSELVPLDLPRGAGCGGLGRGKSEDRPDDVRHFHLESRLQMLRWFHRMGRFRGPVVLTFHEPDRLEDRGVGMRSDFLSAWVDRCVSALPNHVPRRWALTASHPWGSYWFSPRRGITSPMLERPNGEVGPRRRCAKASCPNGRDVILLVGMNGGLWAGWIRRFEWDLRRRLPDSRVLVIESDWYGDGFVAGSEWKRIPKDVILGLMRRARVMCCVGWGHGSAEPFRDAASVGLPVVAEHCPVARHWLREGTAGLLVERERVAEMAIRLCTDDGMWRHLSEESRRVHWSGLRWCAARWFERMYRCLLKRT